MEESIRESAYRDLMGMAEAMLKLILPGKRFFLLACDADENQGDSFAISSIKSLHLLFLLEVVMAELRQEVNEELASAADSEGVDHD